MRDPEVNLTLAEAHKILSDQQQLIVVEETPWLARVYPPFRNCDGSGWWFLDDEPRRCSGCPSCLRHEDVDLGEAGA
jgi:hypothetical protein